MLTDQELTTIALDAALAAIGDLADDAMGIAERLEDHLDGLTEQEADALIERFAAEVRSIVPMKVNWQEGVPPGVALTTHVIGQ
jgi:hypothetical protein